jgi:hypothetical protein
MPPLSPLSRAERFWAKVQKSDGCWLWTAAARKNGYGIFAERRPRSRTYSAHRLSYELTFGPISSGLSVLHRCDNRRCVRPDHLFLGTARENTQDMIAKGRCTAGLYNKVKTHCVNGHEFTATNTRTSSKGKRACRTCERERMRRHRSAA